MAQIPFLPPNGVFTDVLTGLRRICETINLLIGNIGAITYNITASETAASVTPVNFAYPPGHVYRYGTNTTPGTTDMAAAISAALSVANVQVILPGDVMLINSNLGAPLCSSVIGYGWNKSIIQCGPAVTQALSITGGTTTSLYRDFKIDGTATSGATGIKVGNGVLTAVIKMDSVRISNFTGMGGIGLDCRDIVTMFVLNPYIEFCYTNIHFDTQSVAGTPTTIDFHGGWIAFAQTKGVRFDQATGIGFHGVVFQSNFQEGIYIAPSVGKQVNAIVFDQECWFEANFGNNPADFQVTLDSSVSNTILNVEFGSCYFNGVVGTANSIQVNGSFAQVIIQTGCLLPRTSAAQKGQLTFTGGGSGYVSLHPSLNPDYVNVVTDVLGTATNLLDGLGAWMGWAPIYSSNVGNAATTFTGGAVTTTQANYKRANKVLWISVSFSATLNAVTPNLLIFTLPVGLSCPNAATLVTCLVSDGTTGFIGFAKSHGDGTIRVNRDVAVGTWGSGNAVSVQMEMTLEVN